MTFQVGDFVWITLTEKVGLIEKIAGYGGNVYFVSWITKSGIRHVRWVNAVELGAVEYGPRLPDALQRYEMMRIEDA